MYGIELWGVLFEVIENVFVIVFYGSFVIVIRGGKFVVILVYGVVSI